MSETPTPYQTEIQVNEYRRSDWMIEKEIFDTKKAEAMRIIQLLAAIRHFEVKYRILINQSQSNLFDLSFPQMRIKTIHRADIAKRASLRLRQTLNHLQNEMSSI